MPNVDEIATKIRENNPKGDTPSTQKPTIKSVLKSGLPTGDDLDKYIDKIRKGQVNNDAIRNQGK